MKTWCKVCIEISIILAIDLLACVTIPVVHPVSISCEYIPKYYTYAFDHLSIHNQSSFLTYRVYADGEYRGMESYEYPSHPTNQYFDTCKFTVIPEHTSCFFCK